MSHLQPVATSALTAVKLWLLLLTGSLLGASFPLAKLGTLAAVDPVAWTFYTTGGTGLLLLAIAAATRRLPPIQRRHLAFYSVAGLASFAVPTVLIAAAIPHVGSALSASVYTLSPLCTLGLALLLGIERARLFRVAGIAAGFLGALVIVRSRHGVASPAADLWSFALLLVPLSLATGNVARSLAWPKGAGPLGVAAATLLAAALWTGIAIMLAGRGQALALAPEATVWLGAQILVAGAANVSLQRLHLVAGPVYLSQIGYVGSATGVVAAAAVFGEAIPVGLWVAAAIIACGVWLVSGAPGPSRLDPASAASRASPRP